MCSPSGPSLGSVGFSLGVMAPPRPGCSSAVWPAQQTRTARLRSPSASGAGTPSGSWGERSVRAAEGSGADHRRHRERSAEVGLKGSSHYQGFAKRTKVPWLFWPPGFFAAERAVSRYPTHERMPDGHCLHPCRCRLLLHHHQGGVGRGDLRRLPRMGLVAVEEGQPRQGARVQQYRRRLSKLAARYGSRKWCRTCPCAAQHV